MKRVLFLCDGATLASVPSGAPPVYETLDHRGPQANFTLGGASEAAHLVRAQQDRFSDLVRIGAYALAADQRVSRGELDPHGDEWSRDLQLALPVHEPAFWQASAVTTALVETLAFLSGDRWTFHFSQAAAEEHQPSLAATTPAELGHPDCVVLFSGGLDSLCAAVRCAMLEQRRPLLVRRSQAFDVEGDQADLIQHLRAALPRPWHFPALGVPLHRTDGATPRDYTQRSRAFLFAALGITLGQRLGIGDIRLADNGVVSLNLPINEQLLGTKASRSTHPGYLRRLNALVQLLDPAGPKVTNPLWQETRLETLASLRETGTLGLIPHTVSCARTLFRPASQPHCGTCSQCIDRRFATLAAKLEKYDPVRMYGTDIVRHALPAGRDRVMAVSYLDFARDVADIGALALFTKRGMLYLAVDARDPELQTKATAYVDLTRRHGQEVLTVLERLVRSHSTELVQQTLPQHSLLRLWIAGGTRALEPGTAAEPTTVVAPPRNVFRRQADFWVIAFDGHESHLKDGQGLHYLQYLLERPGSQIPATMLSAVASKSRAKRARSDVEQRGASAALDAELRIHGGLEDGLELLDQAAVQQYHERLRDLEALIAESERDHDLGMRDRYQDEFDQITDQLARAIGFGGRLRKTHAPAENARTAVWQALEVVYRKLHRDDPALERFLRASVRTGTFCVYEPVRPIAWVF